MSTKPYASVRLSTLTGEESTPTPQRIQESDLGGLPFRVRTDFGPKKVSIMNGEIMPEGSPGALRISSDQVFEDPATGELYDAAEMTARMASPKYQSSPAERAHVERILSRVTGHAEQVARTAPRPAPFSEMEVDTAKRMVRHWETPAGKAERDHFLKTAPEFVGAAYRKAEGK